MTWLATIVLGVATVTFQDALTTAVKAVLPLDGLHDSLSPQDALQTVEVRDVKDNGRYLYRGRDGAGFLKGLNAASLVDRTDLMDVGDAAWLVTLRGNATQQVRVTDIVPVVEGGGCDAPTGGSLVYSPSQGGEDVLALDAAIDAPVPRLHEDGAKGPFFTGPKAREFTFDQGESWSFLLRASATTGHCRWHYRIHYQVGGRTAEENLTAPHGRPFELTAELPDPGDYRVVYLPRFICPNSAELGSRGWTTADGRWYARGPAKNKAPDCPRN
ncbi:hypothetical protein ACFV3R_30030 [Streptomyces sp. NPDC059740]|uniref:hypothetical protein n=1 Tax=Streptomyces sp. NPDC059740 TaxID=3346926 RepID=UPI003653023A